MQDSFSMFDKNVSLLTAGASGTGFNAGGIGAYTCIGGSYDTSPVGVPNAVGPGGQIGGPLLHDYGRGRRLKLDVRITVAVTSAGAATLSADFICADTADLVTNQTNLLQSGAIAKAALVAGYRFRHSHTPGVIPRRFIGMLYTIGAAALTAGSISSGLMADVDDRADVLG